MEIKSKVLFLVFIVVLSGCVHQNQIETTTGQRQISEAPKQLVESNPKITGKFDYNIADYKLNNLYLNITHPTMATNPIWNTTPLVYIDTSTCQEYLINKIRLAMSLWEIQTSGIIKFKETDKNQANLFVKCLLGSINETRQGDYIYSTLGEGGIKKAYLINNFTVITEAEALIAMTSSDCSVPVRILHEFGHTLGFAHTPDKSSIMYQYEECQQKFTPEMLQTINELYGKGALPDLYFSDVVGKWEDGLLKLEFAIFNRGGRASTSTEFSIDGNNSTIYKESFDEIPAGGGLKFSLPNIKSDEPPNTIKLIIDSNSRLHESDRKNNVIMLVK